MSFKGLAFQGKWRDYQARVLHELDDLLSNDHINIVAAPGAGKTILGLEIMLRLNKPTLIIAPTLTIKYQWIDRLKKMFVVPDSNQTEFDWISTKIKSPKLLTVTTYQALHSAFTNPNPEGEAGNDKEDELVQLELLSEFPATEPKKDEPEEKPKDNLDHVVASLKKVGIKTIILDESHHLRKEWWRALTELKEKLEEVSIVALTATPPYDVDPAEWQKYEELCGPIDAEISIPELVKTKDLCPHQDYIHLSLPEKEEETQLNEFKNQSKLFFEDLKDNSDFIQGLKNHRWILAPYDHQEQILETPEFYSSILIFLNTLNQKIPTSSYSILGAKQSQLPKLSPSWLEKLFEGLLFTHHEQFLELTPTLENIKKDLKKIGAIEKKRVVLENIKEIEKLINSSLGKLNSILEIAKAEYTSLQENLRLVILSDYIRKESLPNTSSKYEKSIPKLGVIPIFEYLRQSDLGTKKIGVLTGSIIILPKGSEPKLNQLFLQEGLESTLSSKELCYDNDFIKIDVSTKGEQKIVHIVTELFNSGEINILVGTQALLGEGWDAPSINSLILASTVGTFMLSNQMRGRAIRIDPKNPEKTANIWHLATLELITMSDIIDNIFTLQLNQPTSLPVNNCMFDELLLNVGSDMRKIIQRFKAFEAPSLFPPHTIENGFVRMSLSDPINKLAKAAPKKTTRQCQKWVDNINSGTIAKALNRKELLRIWPNSLEGKNSKMHPKLATNQGPKTFVFATTIKTMIMSAFALGIYIAMQTVGTNGRNIGTAFLIGLTIAIVVSLPKIIKALWLWIRNGTLENSIFNVSTVVLETLCDWKFIKTPTKNIKILVQKDIDGVVFVRLEGAKRPEEQVFMETLEETLGPIENHRYLIIRKQVKIFFKPTDYHPVPTILGRAKESAKLFSENWNKYVGNGELVYTRMGEGRKILVKARMKSLASSFLKKSKRMNMWE